jgi:hypothetical protein
VWDLLGVCTLQAGLRTVVLGYPEQSARLLEARAAGADVCLTLPFNFGTLLQNPGESGTKPPAPPEA